MIITYRYRIKANSAQVRTLSEMAASVNQVWNHCGGAQEHSRKHGQRWPSWVTLANNTAGSSQMLGLHSDTVQAVCKEWAKSRDKARRRPRWRTSRGSRRSLGWVPFQAARAIKIKDNGAIFLKKHYRLWFSRPIDGEIRAGCFAEDARGRWYLNLQVDIPCDEEHGHGSIGIDLGLKTLATMSDGTKIENPRHMRTHARKLAIAQRARNRKRVTAIHAKIKNARKHYLHEQSTKLVRENETIVVGNVNAKAMTQTGMAKSVLDAGWSAFRTMLRYKAIRHGATYIEANERGTTRTCSACGASSGPKGIAGLGIREWVCDSCGTAHDRDTNAAINLLLGVERHPLAEEIPTL